MGVQDLIVRRICSLIGVEADADVTDVVRAVNEALDLQLVVDDRPLSPDTVQADLLQLATVCKSVIGKGAGKFYSITARPAGKLPIRGFLVMGE